jgi:phospholipase/carboxylesterase
MQRPPCLWPLPVKLDGSKAHTMTMREPVLKYQLVPSLWDTAPVLLLLPGVSGRESELLGFGCSLLPDSVTLLVESSALTHRLSPRRAAVDDGRFTHNLITGCIYDLADTVEHAAEHYHLGDRQLIAVGIQEGAALAAGLLLLWGGALTATVLLRPMLPFVPGSTSYLNGKAVLIVGYYDDPLIPASETEQLATILREASAEVTVRWQRADESRPLQPELVRAWLEARR